MNRPQPMPAQVDPQTAALQNRLAEEEYQRQLQLVAQQRAAYDQKYGTNLSQQGNTPPFPGSSPQAQSDGLLMDTYRRINDFFTPDKSITEMVPASQNPLAAAPGVGVGGEMRNQRVNQVVDEATTGKKQPPKDQRRR